MKPELKTPCKECPWRRDVTPGALGSIQPAETFVGQVYGPFYLPCHCDYPADGSDPNWKAKALVARQCAGAAIMRANIGRADILPPALLKLPANTELVFTTLAEFVAHHKKITLNAAEQGLARVSPHELMVQQLNRPTNVVRPG